MGWFVVKALREQWQEKWRKTKGRNRTSWSNALAAEREFSQLFQNGMDCNHRKYSSKEIFWPTESSAKSKGKKVFVDNIKSNIYITNILADSLRSSRAPLTTNFHLLFHLNMECSKGFRIHHLLVTISREAVMRAFAKQKAMRHPWRPTSLLWDKVLSIAVYFIRCMECYPELQ